MRNTMLWLALAALALALAAAPVAADPRHIDTGPDAEVSFDGLYRVERSVADAAWLVPDLDLSPYRKLLVRSSGVAFRVVEPDRRGTTVGRGATEFQVSERNRELVADLLQEELLDELGKSRRYLLADAPGDDVLLVTAGLFDVVSHVPPESAGRSRTYLRSVGEATLLVEVRDSVSGAILARIVDRRSAEAPTMQESNPLFNRVEVKRLVDSWGRTIRNNLDVVIGIADGGELVISKP